MLRHMPTIDMEMTMQRTILHFTVPLALACALLALPARAHAHDAHAAHSPVHAAATTAATTTPAQRWGSDAALREGMHKIRVALQGLEHYEHGHMGIPQATATVALIDEAVADIFANCKLEPDADVALHGLLAIFIAGAEAVRTSEQIPVEEIARMRTALARYPQLFDDPEFNHVAD